MITKSHRGKRDKWTRCWVNVGQVLKAEVLSVLQPSTTSSYFKILKAELTLDYAKHTNNNNNCLES